jgi:ribosomal protein L29
VKRSEELKNLKDKSNLELATELARAHQDLFKFRTDLAMRSLANVKAIRSAHKRVARIHTIVRERELQGAGDNQ